MIRPGEPCPYCGNGVTLRPSEDGEYWVLTCGCRLWRGDFEPPAGFCNPAHYARYEDAVDAYQRARGAYPDRYWRALLRLLTAREDLWRRVAPYVDLKHGEARLHKLRGLSHGEQLLVAVARNLWGGYGQAIDLADLADTLDAELFELVLETLREYRSAHRYSPTAAGRTAAAT